MKKKTKLEEKIQYLQDGGDIRRFKSSEIIALQQYALDVKNIELYDELELYWSLKNLSK